MSQSDRGPARKTSWAVRLAIIVPLGLFLGLVVVLMTGLQLNPNEVPSALIDKPAPEFALPDLDGGEGGLTSAHLKGQVSVVNVWASWCVPCRAEHPVLVDLKERTGVTMYGLNQKDKPNNAKAFLAELGNPFDRIGADDNRRVSIDFGVYGVPETFIIDHMGMIRHKHIGVITPAHLDSTFIPMIEQLRAEAS